MRNQFLRSLASPTVQAEQVRYYGKSRVPAASHEPQLLGHDEKNFIETRDSFYMATIGHDSWPYIQHRGGPKGFIKVINDTQIAFGDYNGNRQLISTGNVKASQRVALFLMDYPARERLKIIGQAEVLTPTEAEDLVVQLAAPKGAVIERVFRIQVIGFDWNCPKYITPRFTIDEVEKAVAPLKAKIAELETRLRQTNT